MKRVAITNVFEDPKAFRQQLRMPAVQVAGLKPSELEVALAYEVEPLSGIPADAAELAYRLIVDADSSVRVYDVAVRRRTGKQAHQIDAGHWMKILYAVTALVFAALVVDGVMLFHRERVLTKEVTERTPLQNKIDALRGAARQMRQEAAQIRTTRESAIAAQDRVAALRAAHPALLSILSQAFGTRAVMRSFSGDADVTVNGVTVSPEQAADVMAVLTPLAAQRGWRVEPESIEMRPLGSTTSFSFKIRHD